MQWQIQGGWGAHPLLFLYQTGGPPLSKGRDVQPPPPPPLCQCLDPALLCNLTVQYNSHFIFRPFASDGIEIGSLLVPMVLASQIAFTERWPDKNLKVSGTINVILK